MLLDSRHEPQEIDLEFVRWLGDRTTRFALVFTKSDKSGPKKIAQNIDLFKEEMSLWWEDMPPILTTSAHTGQGRQELLGVVGEAMDAIRAGLNREPEVGAPENAPTLTRKERAKAARRSRPNAARPW